MAAYVVRRVIWAIIVVAVVTLLTFAIFYVLPPGDPARRFAGRAPTPETIAAVRDKFGLDEPWYEQYGIFVKNLVTGDEYGSASRSTPGCRCAMSCSSGFLARSS